MIDKQEQKIIKNWKGDKKRPLVSICCITYNHEDYISEALDSFLMQETDFPFEVCLGEDDSSDKTRQICLQYAERYPNIIKLFLRKREDVIYINNLPTGRFNLIKTLKECQGEFIALCEGDDYFSHKSKLQKQVDEMKKYPSIKMSFHKSTVLDSDSRNLKAVVGELGNASCIIKHANMILGGGGYCATSSLIFRKKVFNILPCFITDVIAFDYIAQILASSKGALYLPYDYSIYRLHNTSLSANFTKGISHYLKKNINMFIYSSRLALTAKDFSLTNRFLIIFVNILPFLAWIKYSLKTVLNLIGNKLRKNKRYL